MLRPNMMNNNITHHEEDYYEDAWELDINWPPRSYTCTFCRREFRSAQALGGHMNVHRRDRARLHHSQAQAQAQSPARAVVARSTSSSNSLISWTNNNLGGGGGGHGALFCELPNNNYSVSVNTSTKNVEDISSHGNNCALPVAATASCRFVNNYKMQDDDGEKINFNGDEEPIEELDLELRLGNIPIAASDGSSRLHWR